MNFDHRAQRAARGIRSAAASVPVPPMPGTTVPAAAGVPWMRALSAAAAVLVVGAVLAFVARPGLLAPSAEEGPVVIPAVTTTTEAPETTTTEATTTTVAPSTTTTEPKATTTTTEPKSTTTTTPKKVTPTTKPAPSYVIVITNPKGGTETDAAQIAIRAEVSSGMDISVAGTAVTPSGGVVEHIVGLAPGWNEIWVKGYVKGEKVAYDSVSVYRIPDESYAVNIVSPAPETETDGASVVVSGEATPGLELKVAGIATPVGSDGKWSQTVPLVAGWNEIWAKGYVDGTKVAYDTVAVYRVVAETVDFTANQVYGTCSEDPPYDVFWGTATPGHQIKVWSEYGSKQLTVGASGEWEVRVEFPGSPLDKAIPVYVKNLSTGEVHDFSFTHTSS